MAYIKIGNVASFTDAWIETVYAYRCSNQQGVASFTDAWIETIEMKQNGAIGLSHLLQMRGLKQRVYSHILLKDMSHLLQMRGLKLLISGMNTRNKWVASFTDAWIETFIVD